MSLGTISEKPMNLEKSSNVDFGSKINPLTQFWA